jgi:hypothetical protein
MRKARLAGVILRTFPSVGPRNDDCLWRRVGCSHIVDGMIELGNGGLNLLFALDHSALKWGSVKDSDWRN